MTSLISIATLSPSNKIHTLIHILFSEIKKHLKVIWLPRKHRTYTKASDFFCSISIKPPSSTLYLFLFAVSANSILIFPVAQTRNLGVQLLPLPYNLSHYHYPFQDEELIIRISLSSLSCLQTILHTTYSQNDLSKKQISFHLFLKTTLHCHRIQLNSLYILEEYWLYDRNLKDSCLHITT